MRVLPWLVLACCMLAGVPCRAQNDGGVIIRSDPATPTALAVRFAWNIRMAVNDIVMVRRVNDDLGEAIVIQVGPRSAVIVPRSPMLLAPQPGDWALLVRKPLPAGGQATVPASFPNPSLSGTVSLRDARGSVVPLPDAPVTLVTETTSHARVTVKGSTDPAGVFHFPLPGPESVAYIALAYRYRMAEWVREFDPETEFPKTCSRMTDQAVSWHVRCRVPPSGPARIVLDESDADATFDGRVDPAPGGDAPYSSTHEVPVR